MTPCVLSVGEIIWDVYPNSRVIGGALLNFAAHCKLCGVQSFLLSAVGNDELGDEALAFLERVGVDTPYVARLPYPTGQCTVTLKDGGVPQYQLEKNTAYDHFAVTDPLLDEAKRAKFDACVFGTLIQRTDEAKEKLKKLLSVGHFREILCDINLRTDNYDLGGILFCLSNATVLKISCEEEPELRRLGIYETDGDTPPEIVQAIVNRYPQIHTVLLTDGGNGAYAYFAPEKELLFEPARKVKVASTVGAGDSFGAAWLASYLTGATRIRCLKKATDVSGYVVSCLDAVPLEEYL